MFRFPRGVMGKGSTWFILTTENAWKICEIRFSNPTALLGGCLCRWHWEHGRTNPLERRAHQDLSRTRAFVFFRPKWAPLVPAWQSSSTVRRSKHGTTKRSFLCLPSFARMSADLLRYRGLLAAAVGAGVVLGAAGVFLYHQLHAERARRHLLRQELDTLGGTVAEIQRQLELLRCRRGWKRYRQNAKAAAQEEVDDDADTKTEKSLDLFSIYSTEDDEEEFFDLSSGDEEGETVEEGPLKDLFETVDSLFTGNSECKLKAFNLLMEKKNEYPDSVGLLWRLAKACHSLATIHGNNGDLEKKKEMVMEGYEFAKRALELDDANAEVHKWFAITVGSRGEFIGTREKIEDGVVFKEHVDTALSLHPTDPSLHHLLGRFMYEVATLNWVERKIAGALFAEVPKGTFPEAVGKFEEAEKLSPTPWKENRLLLAKALIGDKDYSRALQWLEWAAEVPVKSPEDAVAEKEIQELLIKYAQYQTS